MNSKHPFYQILMSNITYKKKCHRGIRNKKFPVCLRNLFSSRQKIVEVFIRLVQSYVYICIRSVERDIYDLKPEVKADLHPGWGGDVVDRVHGHRLG